MSEIWAGIRKEDLSHTPAGPDRQETMRTISQLDRICFMDLGGGCRKPTPHNCEELFLGVRRRVGTWLLPFADRDHYAAPLREVAHPCTHTDKRTMPKALRTLHCHILA